MTSEEMFVFDENSEDLGISKEKLMENAGASVASFIKRNFIDLEKYIVYIFCGTGNNGGDGFVVARHLARFTKKIIVYLAGRPERISTPEAKNNWDALVNCKNSVQIETIDDSTRLNYLTQFIIASNQFDQNVLIVDALLGSGIRGDVREPIASIIRLMNKMKQKYSIPIVSIDVPSGLNMDTGKASNVKVDADSTITFHLPKVGISNKNAGDCRVYPIGIPPEAAWIVGKGDVKLCMKKIRREATSTKGMNGKLLIIGGSNQYSGAPSLASLAAQRCGVDLVNACVPKSIINTVRAYSPDLIATPLHGSNIKEKDLDILEEHVAWADTILIGPGAGLARETQDTIINITSSAIDKGKKLVIDADGLKALKGQLDIINNSNLILTPHAGEFSILSGITIESNENPLESRLKAASEFAKNRKCVLLLKGPVDIIINDDKCKLNYSGTPAMTAGGTGDVLAGISAAFASLWHSDRYNAFQVACAAAHINGLVGELVEIELGGSFLTASDMINSIPIILSKFI